MKGWEVSEVIFWVIVAIIVMLIMFLFSNELLMGYLKVKVNIP
jgi:hypothetical protein